MTREQSISLPMRRVMFLLSQQSNGWLPERKLSAKSTRALHGRGLVRNAPRQRALSRAGRRRSRAAATSPSTGLPARSCLTKSPLRAGPRKRGWGGDRSTYPVPGLRQAAGSAQGRHLSRARAGPLPRQRPPPRALACRPLARAPRRVGVGGRRRSRRHLPRLPDHLRRRVESVRWRRLAGGARQIDGRQRRIPPPGRMALDQQVPVPVGAPFADA